MFDTLRRHPIQVLSQVARDPLDSLAAIRDKLQFRSESKNHTTYSIDAAWERHLHDLLEIDSNVTNCFWPLWQDVNASLHHRGIPIGPFSFHEWNDGDAGFVRAVWSLVRHLKPAHVVETGVAHGITTRFILEALTRNASGQLCSIDLPPHNPESRRHVGIAVRGAVDLRRWRYIHGTSRRRLGPLLAELGHVDLFIHDSMHTRRNVMFEIETAWRCMTPGGVIVVDDVDANSAFDMFVNSHPRHPSFVCTAEPLAPDMRRFNQKGLFGIIVKS